MDPKKKSTYSIMLLYTHVKFLPLVVKFYRKFVYDIEKKLKMPVFIVGKRTI